MPAVAAYRVGLEHTSCPCQPARRVYRRDTFPPFDLPWGLDRATIAAFKAYSASRGRTLGRLSFRTLIEDGRRF